MSHQIATRSPSAAPRRRRRKNFTFANISFFAVFLILPLIIFLVFVISPFLQAAYYSLTSWSGFDTNFKFVGLNNYVRLAHNDVFLHAVLNNVILAVVVPILTIFLSLTLAILLTIGGTTRGAVSGIKGASFYRIVSFFPYAIPVVAIGIIWAQVYRPDGGLLNALLQLVHLPQVNWLGDQSTAMPSIIFVIIWGFTGFYTILFIAAIKGIPAEILEAARIDGAGRLRTAISITVPLIRSNMQTAAIYLGIFALDAFVYMSVLAPTGGPNNSNWVMGQELIRTAFQKNQFGLACAMGVVLALITLAFAGVIGLINRLSGGTDAKEKRSTRHEH